VANQGLVEEIRFDAAREKFVEALATVAPSVDPNLPQRMDTIAAYLFRRRGRRKVITFVHVDELAVLCRPLGSRDAVEVEGESTVVGEEVDDLCVIERGEDAARQLLLLCSPRSLEAAPPLEANGKMGTRT
jgi:hypothetical protein|tara:strand:- start:1206 stop:1598 length:393 start_codon:yes stop_codon:yes gene_type:complete